MQQVSVKSVRWCFADSSGQCLENSLINALEKPQYYYIGNGISVYSFPTPLYFETGGFFSVTYVHTQWTWPTVTGSTSLTESYQSHVDASQLEDLMMRPPLL